MGFFDEVVSGLENQAKEHADLFKEVSTLIAQSGGLDGLIQKFAENGLGGIISSWIGGATGAPITADQVIQVIGQDNVTAMAGKVGLTEQQVADGVAKLLPIIVSHLSQAEAPSGSASCSVDGLLGDLRSKLFG